MVAVIASEKMQGCFPLLETVALANEVTLVQYTACGGQPLAGVLLIRSKDCRESLPESMTYLPSFVIEIVESAEPQSSVAFSSSPLLSPLLRKRRLSVADTAPAAREMGDGETLAEINGHAVWKTRIQAGSRKDVNLQAEPWITEERRLFEHLTGRSFMRLVPLVEWFRSVSDWGKWQKPPIRACFMFDDPNLHATHYGHVSFQRIATEGRQHYFHTSFATVPLDQYYVSKKAARLFRENAGELSLLIHGNDHVYRELASSKSLEGQIARMRQALSRIERLQRRSRVEVARVMAPPHGVFPAIMMKACRMAGFEAACVSWGSVWFANQQHEWSNLIGCGPGLIVEGLPVIPRIGMARHMEAQILLTAYLGQPVIFVGHHWDLSDGTEILAELAGFINRMDNISWQDVRRISRGNLWWREEGDTIHVRPFSRWFDLNVHEGIHHVLIHVPWAENSMRVSKIGTAEDDHAAFCEKVQDQTWRISLEGAGRFTVKLEGISIPNDNSRIPCIRMRALARRVLVEARDRMMPLLPRHFQRH